MLVARPYLPHLLPLLPVSYFRTRTVQDLSLREDIEQLPTTRPAGFPSASSSRSSLRDSSSRRRRRLRRGLTIPKPFLLTHGASDNTNGGEFIKRARPAWAAKEPKST